MERFYQVPHIWTQDNVSKRRQKGRKSQRGWMTSREQCLPDTTVLMNRDSSSSHKTCTDSCQLGTQCWEKEVDMDSRPSQWVICSSHPLAEGISFLQCSESQCVLQTTPKDQIPRSAIDDQHKMNPVVFKIFCLIFLCLSILSFIFVGIMTSVTVAALLCGWWCLVYKYLLQLQGE